MAAPAEVGADFDPVAELRALAGRLAAAYEADPSNAALARELRMTLLTIDPPEGEPRWNPIAEIQRLELESRRRSQQSPEG